MSLFEMKCNLKAKIKRLLKLYHLLKHPSFYLIELNINLLDVFLPILFINN